MLPLPLESPLYPVIELLQRTMRWQTEDDYRAKLSKLEAALANHGMPLGEVVPVFAELMALPLPRTRYPVLEMRPSRKRDAILD
ncbi:MAG: hypothetical protein ACI8PT_002518, partial [Gammaproteobacteria bacterium]